MKNIKIIRIIGRDLQPANIVTNANREDTDTKKVVA